MSRARCRRGNVVVAVGIVVVGVVGGLVSIVGGEQAGGEECRVGRHHENNTSGKREAREKCGCDSGSTWPRYLSIGDA